MRQLEYNMAFLSSPHYSSLTGAVFQSYGGTLSLTPDDDVFKHLALTYANNHKKMSRGVVSTSIVIYIANSNINYSANIVTIKC